MKSFLNVGGGSKDIEISPYLTGWRHDLLDIDPKANPDICLDARRLIEQPAGTYDAIYCAHNLEHYYHHDAATVVRGFHHVLKPDGFAEVRVPDLGAVMKLAAEKALDLDDVLYTVPAAGPIQLRDVIFGWQREIRESGADFFSHKNGFTAKSLLKLFGDCGFTAAILGQATWLEIRAFFFKQQPTPEQESFAHSPPA